MSVYTIHSTQLSDPSELAAWRSMTTPMVQLYGNRDYSEHYTPHEAILAVGGSIWLARDAQKQIVGCLALQVSNDERSAELTKLRVVAGHQRKGVATMMVNHAIQHVANNYSSNCTKVYVVDNPLRSSAVPHLYQKVGFDVEDVGEYHEAQEYVFSYSIASRAPQGVIGRVSRWLSSSANRLTTAAAESMPESIKQRRMRAGATATINDYLKHDHAQMRQLMSQLEKNDTERIRRHLVTLVRDHLDNSIVLLQPVVQQSVPDGTRWASKLGKEYVTLTNLTDALQENIGLVANWTKFLSAVQQHMHDEETVTLMWLSHVCERKHLAALGRLYRDPQP